MKFQERVKSHMNEYKKSKLGVQKNGVWKRNNKLYPHILPNNKQDLNLLATYRKELLNYIECKNIHLHQDFHHLNSSQAACLNFFYPLIEEKRLDLLLQILGVKSERIACCAFEKVMSKAEGTNFDFYIKLASGKQIFFEIKYTEAGFGKVADHAKYRKKYQDIYQKRLAGKIRSGISEYQALLDHYQLLRNISYVDSHNDNLLIIICPQDNKKLHEEYNRVTNRVIVPQLLPHIRMITWETLLYKLMNTLQHLSTTLHRLRKHYTLFEEKYMV